MSLFDQIQRIKEYRDGPPKELQTCATTGAATKAVIRYNSTAPNSEVLLRGLDGLIPDIEKRISRATIPNDFRKADYTHVSDLVNKCHRQLAIQLMLGMYGVPETIWPSTRVTFEFGHAAQSIITKLLCNAVPDNLYGHWVCACKKTSHLGVYSDPELLKKCLICGTLPNNYQELRLINESTKIGASVDIILRFQGQSPREYFYVPVECKSVNQKDYEIIEETGASKPEHILQTMFYWRMLREAGFLGSDKAPIIYIPKQHNKAPCKIIWEPMDASHVAYMVGPYYERNMQIRQGTPEAVASIPKLAECQNCDSYKARSCPVAGVCMAMPEDKG